MKVCFPVQKDEGVESQVYNHFGSAPVFIMVDTEEKVFQCGLHEEPAESVLTRVVADVQAGDERDIGVVGTGCERRRLGHVARGGVLDEAEHLVVLQCHAAAVTPFARHTKVPGPEQLSIAHRAALALVTFGALPERAADADGRQRVEVLQGQWTEPACHSRSSIPAGRKGEAGGLPRAAERANDR